ncbi:hypothetical protein [Alkalibacter mobilis]|uniref:hypothetical protein n=1 Tax=Alkalibacter mobilis TaxID=2787712 RepID=UPI00189CBAC3|nr:hypothetical protein [Alkalibacter mobilis]MBF7095900.1 hypothetical protein [Alkalibacter mobilis]
MDIQKILVWALVVFGTAMIIIGIMDFYKGLKVDEEDEEDNEQVKKLKLIQHLLDAFSGFVYAVLGTMALTKTIEVQLVYGLVFIYAIIKKIIDVLIKKKIHKIYEEE